MKEATDNQKEPRGVTLIDYEIHEVVPYVNWLYFFSAWDFPARYGSVAQTDGCPSCRARWVASFPDAEQTKAGEAMKLFDDARAMLHELEAKGLHTHALVALFDARSRGDDIVLTDAEGRETVVPTLRQQGTGQAECLCWADFVVPEGMGRKDTVGVFATSADEAIEQLHPDDAYRHMLCQTLADRLAEATAERMHEEVRRRIWGYAADERLSIGEMLQEKYVGRRPAIGYPSLPDQSLNFVIDRLLSMERIGVRLTASGAMRPHASTSGLLLAHPRARHFAIGHIGDDQLRDYAQRRGMPVETLRKFLAANLT